MFIEAKVNPYVDFNYYVEDFLGKEIQIKEEFDFLVKRVTPILDAMTFDRVKKLDTIPDVVKDALCSMCEAYESYAVNGQDRRVKAENNDGFSQTFYEYDEKIIQKQIVDVGKIYLMRTGLLYKGWSNTYDYE